MIDRHKLFPSNDLYTFKFDSRALNSIEYSISRTELANKYVKKTTRRHQNNKKITRLENERKLAIYNHNKFGLFDAISAEIDKQMPKFLEEQFANFASISDMPFGK